MPEKGKYPDALNITSKILGGIAKGLGGAPKAGYEKVKEARDNRFEQQAVEDIHDVMYAGVKHLPGHPRPAVRTTALSPDELKKFRDACDGITRRGIDLPSYVTNFAASFAIRINRK